MQVPEYFVEKRRIVNLWSIDSSGNNKKNDDDSYGGSNSCRLQFVEEPFLGTKLGSDPSLQTVPATATRITITATEVPTIVGHASSGTELLTDL